MLRAEEERLRKGGSIFNPYPRDLKSTHQAQPEDIRTAELFADHSREVRLLKAQLKDERSKNTILRRRNTDLLKKLHRYENNKEELSDERIMTLDEIDPIVAELFGVQQSSLYGITRTHPHIFARHSARFVAYNSGKLYSLTTIANRYGAKDHSTVIHSLKTIRNLCRTGKIEADIVAELNKMCRVEKL